MLMNENRKHTNTVAAGRLFPNVQEIFQIVITFLLTTIAWIFFRAESIHMAIHYIINIFTRSLFSTPVVFPKKILLFISLLTLIEWWQRKKQHALQFEDVPFLKVFRWALYYLIIVSILLFGGAQQEFIYFQF